MLNFVKHLDYFLCFMTISTHVVNICFSYLGLFLGDGFLKVERVSKSIYALYCFQYQLLNCLPNG